jgi:transposase-like protein
MTGSGDDHAGERAQYTAAEQQAIRDAFATTGTADCPRCGARMHARPIGGGSFGLGYARKREWLMCPKCHRSALFDVKRRTRN